MAGLAARLAADFKFNNPVIGPLGKVGPKPQTLNPNPNPKTLKPAG